VSRQSGGRQAGRPGQVDDSVLAEREMAHEGEPRGIGDDLRRGQFKKTLDKERNAAIVLVQEDS
jgi:hypothetical protein